MQALLGFSLLICLRLQMAQPFATSYDYDLHRSGALADSENIVQQHHDHRRTSQIRATHSIRHQQHFLIEKSENATALPTLIPDGNPTENSYYNQHLQHRHNKQQHTKSVLQPQLDTRLHFNHKTHSEPQRHEHSAVHTQDTHTHRQHKILAKSRTATTADNNTITTPESETTANTMRLVKPTSHPTHVTTKSVHTITLDEANKRTQNYYFLATTLRQQRGQQLHHNHHKKQPKSDSSEVKLNMPSVNGLHAKPTLFSHNEMVHSLHLSSSNNYNEGTNSDATTSMHEHLVPVGGSTENIAGTTSKSGSNLTLADISREKTAEYADDEVEYYDYSSDDEQNTDQHALATVDIGYDYDSGIVGEGGDNVEWHMPALNNLKTDHQYSRRYQEQPQPQRRQQWHHHRQPQQQPHKDQSQHSRVARDHHRVESHQLHNNHLAYDTHSDDDYADDEPYRDSNEQFSSRPGDVTIQKMRELGTMQAVQHSRDLYMQRHKSPSDLATEHINRMKVAARCNRPLPRVIHVSNDTSKTYVPSCTILHRCGEDTGCCRSMGQVCTAKLYEEIPLHFIVIQVNSSNSRRQTEIEILKLRNDTECHCINRTDLTSAPEFITRDKRSGFAFRRRRLSPLDALDPQNELEDRSGFEESDQNNADMVCRCPRHFNVFQEDIRWQSVLQRHETNVQHARTLNCRCDCADANTPCQRFKDGEEGFAMDDRRCIVDRMCSVPNCSFGIYNEHIGRCPRPSRKHKRHNNGFG